MNGDRMLPILQDISQGMRFLHTAYPLIVHGDLKAGNVLLDSHFRAKVADFGLSHKKRLGATGTPFWMAPELLRGEAENNTTTDVYSFGIVVFEMYSRSIPYEGEDPEEVLMLVGDSAVNKRPRIPSTCPPSARSMMIECLSGEAKLRPTFEELDEELKETEVRIRNMIDTLEKSNTVLKRQVITSIEEA